MKPPKALVTLATAALLWALPEASTQAATIELANDGLNHPELLFNAPPAGLIITPSPSALSLPNPVSSSGSSALFDIPVITSVRGRVVKVQVPAGYSIVSLQRRTVRRSQPWAAVTSQSAAAGEITFRLRAPIPKRLLRVVGTKSTPDTASSSNSDSGLLSEFFAEENAGGTAFAANAGGISLAGGNSIASDSVNSSLSLSLSSDTSSTISSSRTVEESDIWKLRGDRLYLFNSYRGLQVIDVADPAHPGLAGSLFLPASYADQLYVPDDQHVVLITQDPSNFQWNQEVIHRLQSAVLVCDVSSGSPQVIARLPFDGQLLESRMVGSALYVATQVYPDYQWYGRANIQVTGFDLRDPAHPVQRNTVTLSLAGENSYSYFNAVQASDHFFFVASNIWNYDPSIASGRYRTRVGLVDISAPDGTVALCGRVPVEGQVQDKFKMQERGGVLSIISDFVPWTNGARHTHLENFSLTNPNQPVTLGELDLGSNESTFATRFDGDRVYIVTFRQIDPLWIVDNSQPAKPTVVGHVQAPGYSTYIEPLGDRLVTIGIVESRVHVSLFDVANPADPKLVQQLPVSQNWAWSEATWNEKAFTVLPEQNLLMVPITGTWFWNWDANPNPLPPSSGIQLIDLHHDALTPRGLIAQPFAPHRSTIHRDSVLALGESSLLSADISDRDHPKIVSDLSLAWRTDFVWRSGHYLIEIGGSLHGGDNVLSVAAPENPDAALSSLPLGNDLVVGADLRDGYVYVLQQGPWRWVANDSTTSYVRPPAHLSIYNVDSAPVLVKRGEVSLPAGETFGSATKFFWPTPGTLAVTDTRPSYPFIINNFYPILVPLETRLNLTVPTAGSTLVTSMAGSESLALPSINFACWLGRSEKKFFTFDVTAPDAPVYLGPVSVQLKSYATFSEVFCAHGKLFLSHQYSWPVCYAYQTFGILDQSSAENQTERSDLLPLYGRHFLDVLDFSTPSTPAVRSAVSAPGVLQGITQEGTRLYFVGPDYEAHGHPKNTGARVVHVGKYQGSKVELEATLNAGAFSSSLVAMENRLFVSSCKPSAGDSSPLATWLSLYEYGDAHFTLLSEIIAPLGTPAVFGHLLLSREFTGHGYGLRAVDFSNPSNIHPLGFFPIGWWYTDPSIGTGNSSEGFWFPLGPYGVLHVPPPPQ